MRRRPEGRRARKELRCVDTAETIEQVEAELAPPTDLEQAEADYERFVDDEPAAQLRRPLPARHAGHDRLSHLQRADLPAGLCAPDHPGHAGFRLRWSPPVSRLQQLGSVISPVIGAAQVEHRKRVLPVSMLMGTLMRVQVAAIAICAWVLTGPTLVWSILLFLLLLGLFQGAQGVAFQLLLAKVIPTRLRGRLQALAQHRRRTGLRRRRLAGRHLSDRQESTRRRARWRSGTTATPRRSRCRRS